MAWPADMHAVLLRKRSRSSEAGSPSMLMGAVTLVIALLALAANVISSSASASHSLKTQTARTTSEAASEKVAKVTHAGTEQFETEGDADSSTITLLALVRSEALSIRGPVDARVDEVMVQPGQEVAKGSVLLRLDNTAHRETLARAEHELAQATLELEISRASVAHDRRRLAAQIELLSAKLLGCTADIQRAQSAAERLDREQRRLVALFRQAHPALEKKVKQVQVEQEIAATDIAKTQARKLELQEELSVVRNDLQGLEVRELEAKQIEGRIAIAKLQVKTAERELAVLVIRAPKDGRILACPCEAGDSIQADACLLTLQAKGGVWLEARSSETTCNRLQVGEEVDVELDTQPPRNFVARVQAITSDADLDQMQSPSGATAARYVIRIALPKEHADLQPGIGALVRLRRTVKTGPSNGDDLYATR